ncbi:tripartite motif-containing protein 16-like [Hippoglossus hippoglossus]|uniref:tripartite motif-containing protein 16-like n=1 Tax=Hippoglossus hippoglossus TaxID=8267 RepID=UPI00148E70E9|nr:tripartite motif-containing protein 16-like [Hippoglossus hippoglossus]
MNSSLSELLRDAQRRQQQQQDGPGLAPQRPRRSRADPGTEGSARCRRHDGPRDVYCCTDEEIICVVCALQEHRGHRIGCVGEERRRKQEELKKIQLKSKQIRLKRKRKCRNLKKIMEQIPEEAKQTADYCEAVLVSVIDSLQRHYLSVRDLIGAQGEAAAARVHVSMQTLEAEMEEMEKRDEELGRLARTDGDVCFLQKWPSLQHLIEDEHLHPLDEASEDPLLPFKFTRRAVKRIGRQMEEFCNKEFSLISDNGDRGEQQESAEETEETEEIDNEQEHEASVSQFHNSSGGDSSLTEPAEEPTTRPEFLHYACELTLDPTTAHEDLVVSVGGKEVKLNTQILRSSVPPIRHPKRFIHRRQVLCREGLQAERCYYEIEVEGDKLEIALVYKGMERKSRTKLSAFGGTAISWSLDRSAYYSVSHNSDSVQLTRCPGHHRIGVYLKFKEGTLSFYEVSDSMIFLYKVESEFTEPLYPGFWLGEKCSIRICDLTQDR